MSIRRIIRLLVVGWIASMVAGTIAAVRMKSQLGPNTDESADEIAAILDRLPTAWSAPRAKAPYPVRARYIVA